MRSQKFQTKKKQNDKVRTNKTAIVFPHYSRAALNFPDKLLAVIQKPGI